MRIGHIHTHNYRSIKNLEFTCNDNVVLLGENNTGKSNILAAIEFALTSSSKPEPEELFAFHDDDDESLWVELIFTDLTAQEKITFKKYVRSDETVRVRKTATWGEDGKVAIQYNGYLEEPTEAWLQSDNAANYIKRDIADATPLAPLLPSGRLSKAKIQETQQQYIREHREELAFVEQMETTPFFGQKNVASGLLSEFYLVPAIRDLDDEAKIKSTTMFGKLLSTAIEDMSQTNERYIRVRSDLQDLIASFNQAEDNDQRPQQLTQLETNLQEELADWNVGVSIKVEPPDISKLFELGTSLYLDDGLDTLAQRKGHGLQRAVVFGLIKAWAKVIRQRLENEELAARSASESIIFAIEEPELFLHPQAQRALATALRQLSESDNHQVFVCSHSSHFVNLDHYQDIVIADKPSPREGTQIRQCTEEIFAGEDLRNKKNRFHMAYWVNPERGEMFFAKKTVFVEGETERSILPFLAEKLACFDSDVSIIDCGSKHNLPLYITIANAFSLNYHVIHDEDPLPDPIPEEWNDDKRREKQRTYGLNQIVANMVGEHIQVSVCPGNFESMNGISKTKAKNKGKALAALEHFQDMTDEDMPSELVSLVKAVYTV